MVWPPPQAPLAALLAASMVPPPDARFTANWAAARERDVARRAAVEARWAEEEEARQEASRKTHEASLRRSIPTGAVLEGSAHIVHVGTAYCRRQRLVSVRVSRHSGRMPEQPTKADLE